MVLNKSRAAEFADEGSAPSTEEVVTQVGM
jgi:hypothetical protein